VTGAAPASPHAPTPWDVLDWRRAVTVLYARVRAIDDPRAAHAHWRATRDDLFGNHPASPLLPDQRAGFAGLAYGPYDPSLRFVVDVDPTVEPQRRDVATGTDGVVSFDRIGRVRLGDVGALDVWWLAGYGGGLFLPVRDPGPATYGGGRYVLDTAKGADLGGTLDPSTRRGGLVVDLNFAYNPSCAYDPAWACPLAPPGNTLTAAVLGGEWIFATPPGSPEPAPPERPGG
jgi:uncharacterized protein (DUF1684 family)